MSRLDIATELHKQARRNYPRRIVNVYGKNDLFQADLIEMIPFSRYNKGYKYILCVIDCFTKFAWAKPLKTKKGIEVTKSIAQILTSRKPKLLQVDNGKEFYNKYFDELIKKCNIKRYSTFSTTKSCIVERFNRTIKNKIYKQFTAQGTNKWIGILPSLMRDYNNSHHRTINTTPATADANPLDVTINHRNIKKLHNDKFKIGDKVRISVYKGIFTKGYLPNWSTEIFTITKINKTRPLTYSLKDYKGNDIAGGFYAEEISKTNFPDDFLVEKIIRKKGDKSYVKWLGFKSTENSWINSSDLKK